MLDNRGAVGGNGAMRKAGPIAFAAGAGLVLGYLLFLWIGGPSASPQWGSAPPAIPSGPRGFVLAAAQERGLTDLVCDSFRDKLGYSGSTAVYTGHWDAKPKGFDVRLESRQGEWVVVEWRESK